MRFVMRQCTVLIAQLQDEGQYLLDALSIVSSTTSSLERIRNEEEINKQITAATTIANKFGLAVIDEFEKFHRRTTAPKRINEH